MHQMNKICQQMIMLGHVEKFEIEISVKLNPEKFIISPNN